MIVQKARKLRYSDSKNTWICIFKELKNQKCYDYCSYACHDDEVGFYPRSNWNYDKTFSYKPATKEQHDLLLQKMEEAGYEWDDEKKELKKIEPKPADETSIAIKNEEAYRIGFADGEAYANEQKSAEWSEDDEEIIDGAIGWLDTLCDYLRDGSSEYIYDVKSIIKKLKSLRPQPRQKWSEEDKKIIDFLQIMYERGKFDDDYFICRDNDKTITAKEFNDFVDNLRPQNHCGYNPYKATVESIAKMCDKYENAMWNEEDARDFLANIKVKCKDAKEYDANYESKY